MFKTIAAFAIAVSFLTVGAAAQERATPEEARAMAEAAAEFLQTQGPEIALPAFTEDAAWRDRDLYVFVFDPAGTNIAHGADAALVGQDLTHLTDAGGVHFVQAFLAVEDAGWVEYVYAHPVTGQDEPKQSYVIRVGDYVLGVGAYTPAANEERATAAEAQEMAEAAAALLQAQGTEAALVAFNAEAEWRDRDLYVFVLDPTGVTVAHGADPTQIGRNVIDLADADGVYFVRAFLAVEDAGWVGYVYTNPVNGVSEPKQSYVIRVGDLVVGVGAYVAP